jgi:altronate dehydratase large subunit
MKTEEISWQGYARKNGRPGIRNRILVLYTVKCAEFAARKIVEKAADHNVQLVGFDGCTDNQYAVNMLESLISHPNTGAVLVIGLGCEYIQADRLAGLGEKEGKPSAWLLIQKEGGTCRTIEKGLAWVSHIKAELKFSPRVRMTMKDLVIGAECGGSDYTSGLAGNAVVGRFFDHFTDQGGTAVFEEIVEAIGLRKQLSERGINETVKKQLAETYDKALAYCRSVHQYSISPGNFAGGLTTIEEKSMGALVKSGSRPIQGVLKVSDSPDHAGLWLLDSTPDPYWMQFGITNPNDSEGLMDLISCGAHLVFLVTGRGSVIGSAVSPCIKITGNHQTYLHMMDDMEFDASPVLSGEQSRDQMAEALAAYVQETASGKETKSEAMGHQEYYIPYKYQNRDVFRKKRCEQ